MPIKKPGVCIVENNAFPTSIVEVATAVPAFIGYTEKAVNGLESLLNRPWRISSMAEYIRDFGGPARARFRLGLVTTPASATSPPADARGQSTRFEWHGRTYQLSRAAGKEGGRYLMHQALKHFFQNGGGACFIVSVGGHDAAITAGTETTGLIGGLSPLRNEQEPTMVLVPDAVLMDEASCIRVQQRVLQHCGGEMRNRVAILDIWGGDRDRRDAEHGWDCIDSFRNHIGIDHLDFAAAYYPWLHTSLVQPGDLDDSMFEDSLADLGSTDADTAPRELLARAMDEARRLMNLMPPSPAIAGVYTAVDNTRGVWKAPANVNVAGVVAPAVDVSPADQEDLNVSTSGKSINAIRSFVGEGVLVWGARTLDGNSLDWRYINVRRTMIMLEESCRLAAKALVFEPNTAGTWLALRTMIGNYLTGVWKRGGLSGAVPEDAFSVHVGLGETMTPEDILEGILRVTVLLAISRPAEFIEITFQQQMQKS